MPFPGPHVENLSFTRGRNGKCKAKGNRRGVGWSDRDVGRVGGLGVENWG